ncbi:MAG: hypothetical protein C0483_07745 [Pirellula sp.]|nr:hypothetical protein [Pirellula sp.]
MKRLSQYLALVTTTCYFVSAQPAPVVAQPAAEPPAGAAAPAAEPAADEPLPQVTDPAILALIATNPTTPEDLLNTSLLLSDLKYPKHAKKYFRQLLETAVDEEQLATLGQKAGIDKITRLTGIKDFQPQGADFVRRVNAATNRANRDPARLAELIEKLKSPDVGTSAGAIVSLRSGGDAAAQALVDVLADPTRASEHRGVIAALAGGGDEGIAALTEVALYGDEAQRKLALDTLGYVDSPLADAPLFAAAFNPTSPPAVRSAAEGSIVRRRQELPKPVEAAAQLYLEARHAYLARPTAAQRDAKSAVWRWDNAAKKPVQTLVAQRAATLDRAASLARTSAELAGNDLNAQLLASAASLESKLAAAPDRAEMNNAAAKWLQETKPTAVELGRLLQLSIENQHTTTAEALVRLLASTAGSKALESRSGKSSLLVQTVQSPDRRLRFAALKAVMSLDPQQPFAGSSAVGDALNYFAGSGGARKALAVDTSPARARDVAGILSGLGYQSEAVGDARSAVRLVSGDADYELVLMYRTFLDPVAGQLLAQLRADPRTAQLPVAVYCEPDDVDSTRSTLYRDPFAAAIYQPRMTETLAAQLAELQQASAGSLVPAAERAAQGQWALTTIGKLMQSNNRLFSTRQMEPALLAAAWNPAVSKAATTALGLLGSSAAQRTLVDVASSESLPLDVRQNAAKSFCDSVLKHNILLTTSEVLRQYDRYNASASADRPTQELLAAMLDAVEARNAPIRSRAKSAAAAPTPATPAPADAKPVAPAETVPAAPAAVVDPFAVPAAAPPAAPPATPPSAEPAPNP